MDQKNNILTKSESLFRKYGIKSVTMDDIARELGISKKTLYQFVDNKSDLIEQIMKNHAAEEKEAFIQIQNDAIDAIDEILKLAKYGIQQLRDLAPTIVYDLQKYYKKSWQIMESLHVDQTFELIKENLERGIKEGFYRNDLNPEIVAKLYVGKTMVIVDESIFPLKDFNKENLFKEYINYHIHGIASAKGLKKLEKHLKNNKAQTL